MKEHNEQIYVAKAKSIGKRCVQKKQKKQESDGIKSMKSSKISQYVSPGTRLELDTERRTLKRLAKNIGRNQESKRARNERSQNKSDSFPMLNDSRYHGRNMLKEPWNMLASVTRS